MWHMAGKQSGRTLMGALMAVVAMVIALVVPVSPAAAQAATNAGGEYTPVVPFRVLDTRFSGVTVKGGQPINRVVAGVAGSGVPATGVLAVAMNVTVVGPTTTGYLTLWPAGAAMPPTSNLNFRAGQIVPNLAVSGVGAGGQVGIFLSAGSAHVLIDVVGWYANSTVTTRGARLIPVAPKRILDTRSGLGSGSINPLGPGSLALAVRGVSPVPNSNVTGVVLNVTAVGATADTFITVYPDDQGLPNASNLNISRGQTRPNLVMVKLGAGGGVRLYNRSGAVHLIADVVGYYQTGAAVGTFAGRVVPLAAPFRAFDTREYATRLGPNQREAWNFQPFVDSLSSGGNSVGPISGVILNITSTNVSSNTYLTVFPDDSAQVPFASTLNPEAGQDIPNLAVVALSRGSRSNHIAAYNYGGYLHYLADATAVILSD